jgi:single-strand DNA-binding protein
MLNRVVIIGRLTKDVELRYTPNGNATCSFTLAVDRQMKGADGNKQTDFLNVNVPPFRGKLAELCSNFLSKGKLAAVDGSVETRNYDNKDGQKVYITEIIAESVRFLSPKNEGDSHTEVPANFKELGKEVNMDQDIPF